MRHREAAYAAVAIQLNRLLKNYPEHRKISSFRRKPESMDANSNHDMNALTIDPGLRRGDGWGYGLSETSFSELRWNYVITVTRYYGDTHIIHSVRLLR